MDDMETLIGDARSARHRLKARADRARAALIADGWTPPDAKPSKLGKLMGSGSVFAATLAIFLFSTAALLGSIGLAIIALRWTAGLL